MGQSQRYAASDQSRVVDRISQHAIDELVRGAHGAPFDLLGPHRSNQLQPNPAADTAEGLPEPSNRRQKRQHRDPARSAGAESPATGATIIRAFIPGARSAWVVPLTDHSSQSPSQSPSQLLASDNDDTFHKPSTPMIVMSQLHPSGLFSLATPRDFSHEPYAIEVEYADGTHHRTRDPYSFDPLISDFDLHLLGEGTDNEAYRHLGAHPRTIGGVTGVAFAVWAPNAKRVSVVGDFNAWDERALPMRLRSGGIWELFVPGVAVGALYKFAILSWKAHYRVQKADPFAFAAEVRPGTASRVYDLGGFAWGDETWMRQRAEHDPLAAPMAIYEVHAGSWRPDSPGDARPDIPEPVSYRGLAHQLVPYLLEMGYTHVELMPITEYPFDGSWGYQVTGYYAPTSRYGTPHDFMYFVDYCHQHGIGVLLDWVPAHFPKDEHGLNFFDGTHLYEHADPRLGEHPDWGTLVFNYGRHEVVNFLLANALFWLDIYHIDGLRVDAVASMLYRDYSRKSGEWLPNEHGGRENLEAITFLRRFNELVHQHYPGAVTIAEESTAWPMVSRPTYIGGLGFTFKWNMGWMHDVLRYVGHDPIHRRFHQNELTFSLMYAYSENFILPFSHDEVVHIKGSMLNKMPGDVWQKAANLRALYAFMYGHPGKKLLFMGGEFGQWSEWNYAGWLDWRLLDPANHAPSMHARLRDLVRDLNHLLRTSPALFERDYDADGFAWIDCSDAENSVVAFRRSSGNGQDLLLFVCNFTPVPRYGYRIGVPQEAYWSEVLNTDSETYGGSNVGNQGGVPSEPVARHGHPQSIALTLPPLATMIFRPASLPQSVPAALESSVDTPADPPDTTDTPPAPGRRVHTSLPSRRRRATKTQAPTHD